MSRRLSERHLALVPDPPPAPEPPSLPVNVLRLRPVRCECRVCGAHTITDMCYSVGGNCQNCGSYDLVPVIPVWTHGQ
jgi:hypothetical protein